MLADKIKAAGGQATYRDYPGVTHEFFGMGNVVAKAKQAETAVVDDLKTAFGSTANGLDRRQVTGPSGWTEPSGFRPSRASEGRSRCRACAAIPAP